ncbi:MAG: hypothetical protein Q8L41_13360 [Anaerolineales bacterium]|nr:hypothetical protein [Anaerolineales bacterium]MDP2777927.1 hypothetical protein [Anaerolineales bacterium]
MSVTTYVPQGRSWRVAINRIVLVFARHWLIVFSLLMAVSIENKSRRAGLKPL